MERRFYRLRQFLGGYFHEDRAVIHGSSEQALAAAMADYPGEMRRQVRRELVAVMDEYVDDVDLRRVLNHGLGVNLYFRKPKEARAFAEGVERKLSASLEQPHEQGDDGVPR